MRTTKAIFFALITLCFSMVAHASDSGLKAGFNLEPQYAVISGLDMQAFEPVFNSTNGDDIAYMADNVTAFNFDTIPIIEGLSRLSITDKEFYYSEVKMMNAAKMQNQNFDRVIVSYRM